MYCSCSQQIQSEGNCFILKDVKFIGQLVNPLNLISMLKSNFFFFFFFFLVFLPSKLQFQCCDFSKVQCWNTFYSILSRALGLRFPLIFITKTYLYNFDPLKPHFYTVKLGFTGVYIIFLISAQNTDCVYSLEPPRRGGSNEYPQSMFCAEIWEISEFFIWKFSVFGEKISIYLNRRVFVMLKTI